MGYLTENMMAISKWACCCNLPKLLGLGTVTCSRTSDALIQLFAISICFAGRILHEISLKESIRYSDGDPVESWLNDLLCLDASTVPHLSSGCPVPSECQLYYVNRDTLFSYHKASETFLQRLMALYVSSHYKVNRRFVNMFQLVA